jgi:hypothetical protein
MRSVSGIARSNFLLNGREFVFGSLTEAIAILAFSRERSIRFSSALFPIIDPSKAEKAVKDFRNTVFPENIANDKLYEEAARQTMKRLMGRNIMIKPEKTIGILDFKRVK